MIQNIDIFLNSLGLVANAFFIGGFVYFCVTIKNFVKQRQPWSYIVESKKGHSKFIIFSLIWGLLESLFCVWISFKYHYEIFPLVLICILLSQLGLLAIVKLSGKVHRYLHRIFGGVLFGAAGVICFALTGAFLLPNMLLTIIAIPLLAFMLISMLYGLFKFHTEDFYTEGIFFAGVIVINILLTLSLPQA